MSKYISLLIFLIAFLSCKIQPGSDRHYADVDDKKVYKIRLNPNNGTRYYYDISNDSRVKLELGEKKVDNHNWSQAGVLYEINKDSSGDFIFNISYDKIHLNTKSGEDETEMDAANASTTVDPIEKMLGALVTSRVIAVISPTGEVKSVKGYKEMIDKIMSGFNNSDENTRRIARQRLDQLIGNGIIKKSMDQLFRIFPDSAVHIGDKWKMDSQEKGELNLKTKNILSLKKIEDGTATLESTGEITNDSTATSLMGYDVTANLKGLQHGVYEIDTRTGLVLDANINANVEGTIVMMGREVPISIETTVKMKGHKVL